MQVIEPIVTTPWIIAPEDQGQTIEYAYAADWEGGVLWMRKTDRSGPETVYLRASADQLRGEWEPQSAAPRIRGDWE